MSEVNSSPVEMPDPFQGQETTHEEFSKWRETGELPERFKPATEKQEVEPPTANAETVDGKGPDKEAEQEKKELERDEQGKFRAREKDEPLFNAEQQKAFDRALAKRLAKERRDLEAKYRPPSAETSSNTQDAAPAKEPEFNPDGSPKAPVRPKLESFDGTVPEYYKALDEYEARKDAYRQVLKEIEDNAAKVEQKLRDSQTKAAKKYPDYKEEIAALVKDIANNDETGLPKHVENAIRDASNDPSEILYHLAKNREEWQHFASLKPDNAKLEVARLDGRLAALAAIPAPVKAPAPPKPKPPDPVGARASSGAFDVNDENVDIDTWTKQRNEQAAKNRRR